MNARLSFWGIAAALIVLPSTGLAQLPQRRPPPPGADPQTMNPPPIETREPQVGTRDPGSEVPDPATGTLDPVMAAPPAVRPGTTLREPGALRSRELVYLAQGEAPANVQVTSTAPRSVTLTWTAPPDASGYWIHQADAGQTTYYRGGSLVTETTATVHSLLPGTAYSFKVSAIYPQELQRREGLSGAVSAMTGPAPAPSGLAASVTGKAQITLTWDKLPGVDWFRLIRNGAPLTDIKPIAVTQGGPASLRTTYDDPVGPGTYLYQIQAVYLAGAAQATSAAVPTPPLAVTIKASTRVRYCQTRALPACGEAISTPTVIAARSPLHQPGRKSP